MRPKTTRRHPLSLSAALLALGLTACDPASQAMLAGASLVSFVHTDKTVGDHVATWAFDQDYPTLPLPNGEGYCRACVSAEDHADAEASAKTAQAAHPRIRPTHDPPSPPSPHPRT